jgi:hypothetical protein
VTPRKAELFGLLFMAGQQQKEAPASRRVRKRRENGVAAINPVLGRCLPFLPRQRGVGAASGGAGTGRRAESGHAEGFAAKR